MSRKVKSFEIFETLYQERRGEPESEIEVKFSVTLTESDLAFYDAVASVMGTTRARIVSSILSESVPDTILSMDESDALSALKIADEKIQTLQKERFGDRVVSGEEYQDPTRTPFTGWLETLDARLFGLTQEKDGE